MQKENRPEEIVLSEDISHEENHKIIVERRYNTD